MPITNTATAICADLDLDFFGDGPNVSFLKLQNACSMIYSYQGGVKQMATAVKKTISLPPDLAREVEEMAREEGKPVSAVIQDALRLAKRERLKRDFYQAQSYWSNKAREKGILSEEDLVRYLRTS